MAAIIAIKIFINLHEFVLIKYVQIQLQHTTYTYMCVHYLSVALIAYDKQQEIYIHTYKYVRQMLRIHFMYSISVCRDKQICYTRLQLCYNLFNINMPLFCLCMCVCLCVCRCFNKCDNFIN